jgi:hypothetical protein
MVAMLAYGSVTFAVMAFSIPMFGFFGKFVTGIPGTILCLAFAALWGYLTWSNSRLHLSAWWTTLVAQLLLALSRRDASATRLI